MLAYYLKLSSKRRSVRDGSGDQRVRQWIAASSQRGRAVWTAGCVYLICAAAMLFARFLQSPFPSSIYVPVTDDEGLQSPFLSKRLIMIAEYESCLQD